MFAPHAAPRSLQHRSPHAPFDLRTVAFGMCWAFAALWPFAAFALLAFVVADPLVTPMRLVLLSIVIAAGSAVTAVIDGWMLSNKAWWTTAQL